MEIHVDIQRSDLIRLSLYLFPRLRGNWITLIVLIAGIFIFIMTSKTPHSPYNIAVAVFASVAGGICGVLISFVINLIRMILTVGKRSGTLGKHFYTLTQAGLREVTEANDSLQKWSGIEEITVLPHCIYIRINGYLFHIIPRRSFSSEESFEAFIKEAKALHEAA